MKNLCETYDVVVVGAGHAGNGVVGLVSEEDANPVGRMFQVVML